MTASNPSVPPGGRDYYVGTDKEGKLWRIPRNANPADDGTRLAAHHPKRFDVTADDDSIPIEAFDTLIEQHVDTEVLIRIDQVVEAGTFLAAKGLADAPPEDLRAWRRAMMLSWSHARDLAVVHDALGHPRYVAGHDVDEVVLAKRLKEGLGSADAWYRDYVSSLDDGAWVNVGFFNPHLSASLFRWGDTAHDPKATQNAMNAHRLAAHHNGTPEHPLDWVEKAVNFVVHHIPREHWGIRHEPRGQWSELEVRLSEDPAIRNSEIGKVIARDAAQMFQMLEGEGKVIPWKLLKVPQEQPHAVLEHAHLVVSAAASHGAASVSDHDDDEARNPARVARARTLLLDHLPRSLAAAQAAGNSRLVDTYRGWLDIHA